MTRIMVNPDRLRALSEQLDMASHEVGEVQSWVSRAIHNLDMEHGQRASLLKDAAAASSLGQRLCEQASSLRNYLSRKASLFEEADRQGVAAFQAISNKYPPSTTSLIADPRSQVVSRLRELEGLKEENWRKLSPEERRKVLEQAHKIMMAEYGVPAVPIYREDLNDGIFADLYISRPSLGFARPGGDSELKCEPRHIQLDDALFTNRDPAYAMQALTHESRHIIQMYAVEHPDVLIPGVDAATRRKWAENFANYKDASKHGVEKYMLQPLEADAFKYGREAVKDMYGRAPIPY